MKQPKPIIEGDKFSSREGCKGVVGQIKEANEMPFTEEGIIPDMILSTLSVPTRMIVGELIEMIVSRHNVAKGIITDGTCFSKVDVYDLSERLEKMGINPFSNEVMYDGKTGEKLEYRVFNSVVFQ
jgi:DNA-directed RNA polymerase beta subunit